MLNRLANSCIRMNTFKPSSIHAFTFGIHVDEVTPHGFWFITTLNDLFMTQPTFFKCQYIITHNQHPHKSDSIWQQTFLDAFTKFGFLGSYDIGTCEMQATWQKDIITVQETKLHECIFLNDLQASFVFPHLEYISTKLLSTKIFDS